MNQNLRLVRIVAIALASLSAVAALTLAIPAASDALSSSIARILVFMARSREGAGVGPTASVQDAIVILGVVGLFYGLCFGFTFRLLPWAWALPLLAVFAAGSLAVSFALVKAIPNVEAIMSAGRTRDVADGMIWLGVFIGILASLLPQLRQRFS